MTEPAPAPAPQPAPTPAPSPAAKWFEGIDAENRGWAENKGWLGDNPAESFAKAVKAHREAQGFIGAPPEELLRMPRANADTSEVRQFLTRLGVPAEAKDYDLSSVKFTDGTDLDQGFSDSIRGIMFNARVPSDRAAEVVRGLVKMEEANDAADRAERTTRLASQNQQLETNWGKNYDVNMMAARIAFEKTAAAAGMPQEAITAEVNRVFAKGKVENAVAMEMWRILAQTMTEARFITGGPQTSAGPMSREAALAEIEALKKDKEFFTRWQRGDRTERQKWDNLHKIAFGQAA